MLTEQGATDSVVLMLLLLHGKVAKLGNSVVSLGLRLSIDLAVCKS